MSGVVPVNTVGSIERVAERVALAADGDLGALGGGVRDMFFHLLDRCHIDQRPDGDAGLKAVADLELAHCLR